ncbi:TPA: hypothetical protein ACOTFX_001211 [Clostridium perfringens]|uniref:hypothetical protein n=1 Tax=Clostridium perfringens TaxID=1502 RepID=UPI001009A3BC|nr:hypothetical protein [Clostridium perfringens]MDJ8931107.1 hypothetical protein [Clostridium perfringens]MDJ8936866.1 hypothetical protein [Clostridium perfringens]MDJ8939839.1 hypothetical protein [Clostridium perfringens]MDK0728151.1 hypothetical protein [Clostridium perfringens]MDM0565676.1 hypothetical protein [Clostridium perfringens]
MSNKINLNNIEFWENEYLKQIYYLLKIDEEKMLRGFDTKEEIRGDWERFLGAETSDFATGSERIFYWLFSQFGVPNSSPIGSDMFFETYNAYVHIDIKTVTLANIGDFRRNIFVGDNQNSYIGNINLRGGESRSYKGNLPTYYTKNDGSKKLCLTYFIVILYNEINLDIQTIAITCMPNGELNSVYGDKVISAGKNKGKIRFNYSKIKKFELLPDKPYRTKVLLWNKSMDEDVLKAMSELKDIYDNQID